MCFFKKKVEPETVNPQVTKKIQLAELYNLLHAHFPQTQILMSDQEKYLCHYDDIALFLAQDETNKAKFTYETYDCDDFAFRLKGQFSIPGWSGLALGICWTQTHALNLFVSEDKKIYFLEPQNDTITEVIDGIPRIIIM